MEPQECADVVSSPAQRAEAFAAFYDAHLDEVYRFVHRRCRDHALAEDITQETFMKAIRSTDDPSTLSVGWLLTVARNRLMDVFRRDTRDERRLHLVDSLNPSGHEVRNPEVDVDERLRVERALDQLSVDYRLILTLHYIDGFTVPALAEHLGRSVKSIEGVVTRARRELRSILDDRAGDETGGRHG